MMHFWVKTKIGGRPACDTPASSEDSVVQEWHAVDCKACLALRGKLPGPTSYQALAGEVGALVEQKQAAYGDSFGKSGQILRILYPSGISLEQLDDALTIVRIIDKLFRLASAPPSGDPMGESPWRDICGYSVLALKRCAK